MSLSRIVIVLIASVLPCAGLVAQEAEYPRFALQDFLIGVDRTNEEIYDISFVEDMLPNEAEINATGRSAQLMCIVRIVKDEPLLCLKIIHFQRSGVLGINQIKVTSASESVSVKIDPKMVMRQSVDYGTIEFATLVPSHSVEAAEFLDAVVRLSGHGNIEVAGNNDRFTTFRMSRANVGRTVGVANLFLNMKNDASWIAGAKQLALPAVAYQAKVDSTMAQMR